MTEDELFEDVRYWKGCADAATTERNEARAALAMRNSDVQELVRVLRAVRRYIEDCDHEPAVDEIDAAIDAVGPSGERP